MNRTKFTDNEGRSETYQFDNFGRTVGLIDAAGNGSQYSYTDSSNKKKNNTLATICTEVCGKPAHKPQL